MQVKTGEERRRSPRFKKKVPTRFNFIDSSPICDCSTVNISKDGVMLDTSLENYNRCSNFSNDNVVLDINLVENISRIRPAARIVWRDTDLEKRIVNLGLEFTKISKSDHALLDSFISSTTLSNERPGGIMRPKKITFEEKFLTDRERRNLAILEVIRKQCPVSRTEISHSTGINIVTISNYVDNYVKSGLILEGGLDVSTGGRRPELLSLNPDYAFVVGIDFGLLDIPNPKINIVLVNLGAKILAKASHPRRSDNLDENIDILEKLVKKVIQDSGVEQSRIVGIGIGLCGIIDKNKGTIRNVIKGEAEDYTSVVNKLSEEFNLPVLVENEHIAAIFGERWVGLGAEDIENILYLSSDSGCGIIIKGQLYEGSTRSAGELTINFSPSQKENKNCWENNTCLLKSRGVDLGIVSEAKAIFQEKKNVNSEIIKLVKGDIEKIDLDVIAEAAKRNDKMAEDLITKAGEYLGIKVAHLINIFNPQIVIIGRYIESISGMILESVMRMIRRWSFAESANAVRVVLSSLGEDSVAIGVATLVMQELFKYANV